MENVGKSDPAIDGPLSPRTTLSGNTLADEKDLEAQCVDNGEENIRYIRFWRRLLGHASETWAEDDPATRLRTRTLEECPNGYPRLACFLSSDQNFMTYRGFDYLHSRVLLNYQDELVTLERKLDRLDKADAERETAGLRTGLQSRAKDLTLAMSKQSESRQDLIAEIKQKLLDYDEVLLKAREVATLQRPSNRDYRSVRNWCATVQPVAEKEQAFVECREDIVTLRGGRECAGFEGAIESALHKLPRRLTNKFFLTPELRAKTSSEVCYFAPSRIETFANLIITVVIFILLIVPVMTMYRITGYGGSNPHAVYFKAIGVLIVFTLLFGAAMSLLTRARRHELFAASAAYCAVLVVFVGNFGGLG